MSDHGIAGLAWDHRRCWGPLEADASRMAKSGGPDVSWRRRSLFSFGEGDLGELVPDNDLLVFDHPFTGDVARRGLMMDLAPFLTDADTAMLRENAVGRSFDSYAFEGGLYGLPIDAAATTSAWRADLLERLDVAAPESFEDVLALGVRARNRDLWMAWAAKPTDLMCAYVAMMASLGVDPGRTDGPFVPFDMSKDVLARILELRKVIHPGSFTWNPIQLFDHMTTEDDVVYTPYAFNYITYACLPQRALTFGSPPRLHADITPRGLLGGAGLGISMHCENPRTAFDYAMRLVAPGFQATHYVADGGQPGMRPAWVSPDCDEAANGFFSGCLPAIERAYLRPNLPGFVDFFHEATMRFAAVVNEGASHDDYWRWQTGAYDALRAGRRVAAAE